MGKLLAQILAIIFKPRRGGLNQDVDPRYLANGDFLDSLNTRSTTTLGGSTGDRENVLGNDFSFRLPSPLEQNKIYRVYIEYILATATARTLHLLDGNGVAQATAPFTPVTSLAATFTAAKTAITTAWNGDFGTITYSALTETVVGVSGYFTVTMPGFVTSDFTLTETGNVNEPQPLVVQEAYDSSMSGQMICIGSYDLQGKLYIWSSNQAELPSEIAIADITNDSGTIKVHVADTSLLDNFSWVVISGVQGVTAANGGWIIDIQDATTFLLTASVFGGSYTSGTGVITINSLALGEIGIAQRNEDTQDWTYHTLIRSRNFNFRIPKQVKAYCEESATTKSLYWTDDYNVPRVLYDKTVSYQNNCLLTFVDPLNTYDYPTVGVESRLILNTTDIVFSFDEQLQSGGEVPSGNSRYTVRLVTESNTYTDWLPLTNPIPATRHNEGGSGFPFFGEAAGFITPKINQFNVSGNILGIFKYIELATVNYLNVGYTGLIVRRDLITSNDFTIRHTGQETSTQDLDLGTLNAFTQVYSRAKNIDSLSGRLILSNLETTEEVDLSDYFSSINYTVNRALVEPSVGRFIPVTIRVGEYEMADNVNNYTGYMLNERYRFGAFVEWVSGGYSKVFHIDDIAIDLDVSNPRKTVGFADYNYTDASSANNPSPYSYFVTFDINPSASANGVTFSDIVKRVFICRCPVDNPQILASGVAIPSGVGLFSWKNGAETLTTQIQWCNTAPPTGVQYGEFPFVAGLDEGSAAPTLVDPTYQDYTFGIFTYEIDRSIAAVYFPDEFMNNMIITPNTGLDQILNYGMDHIHINKYLDNNFGDYILEGDGYDPTQTTFDILGVDEAPRILAGGSAVFSSARVFSKNLFFKVDADVSSSNNYQQAYAPSGLVIGTNTSGGFKKNSSDPDRAFYRIQYRRPIASADDQYGSRITSKYMWTGTLLDCSDFTPPSSETLGTLVVGTKYFIKDYKVGDDFTNVGANRNSSGTYFIATGATPADWTNGSTLTANTVDTFGGDTMIQKCWYKNRYPRQDTPTGFGQGVGFYCPNRINFQMRQSDSTVPAFPNMAAQTWLKRTTSETLVYNRGYNGSTTSLNTLQLFAAFDPDPESSNNDFPVRIAYSENKVPESAQDSYRVFMPFNFKDLDYKDGEIMHHAIFNGELVTWQVLKLMRQYFNPTGMLNTTTGSEIILGDGAVLQRRGQTITTYGTKNGFSISKGKSQGGNDTFYWIDTTNRACFRLGYDGTVNLGVIHGMDSYIANRLRFVDGIDTPAAGTGICSTWNERNKEWIVTVRGYKTSVQEWTTDVVQTRNYIVTFASQSAAFSSEPVTGNMGGIGQIFYRGTLFLALVALSEDGSYVEFEVGEVITGTFSGATATITAVTNYYMADEVVESGVTEFEEFPAFFTSQLDYNFTETDTAQAWEQISIDDYNYYNIYTLCFNEQTNKWDTFYTFKPKIYLGFKNTYLSPCPVDDGTTFAEGEIFEHGRGGYCSWYGAKLAMDGYYTFPMNAMPDDIKTANAIRLRTSVIPSRVDIISSGGQETFMTSSQFIFREMNYDASVRNDIITSSNGATPTEDTSKLYGDMFRVKLTFAKNIYQKLYAAMLKVKIRPRNNQS